MRPKFQHIVVSAFRSPLSYFLRSLSLVRLNVNPYRSYFDLWRGVTFPAFWRLLPRGASRPGSRVWHAVAESPVRRKRKTRHRARRAVPTVRFIADPARARAGAARFVARSPQALGIRRYRRFRSRVSAPRTSVLASRAKVGPLHRHRPPEGVTRAGRHAPAAATRRDPL